MSNPLPEFTVNPRTPQHLREIADRIESGECTGVAASWCPVHGHWPPGVEDVRARLAADLLAAHFRDEENRASLGRAAPRVDLSLVDVAQVSDLDNTPPEEPPFD